MSDQETNKDPVKEVKDCIHKTAELKRHEEREKEKEKQNEREREREEEEEIDDSEGPVIQKKEGKVKEKMHEAQADIREKKDKAGKKAESISQKFNEKAEEFVDKATDKMNDVKGAEHEDEATRERKEDKEGEPEQTKTEDKSMLKNATDSIGDYIKENSVDAYAYSTKAAAEGYKGAVDYVNETIYGDSGGKKN